MTVVAAPPPTAYRPAAKTATGLRSIVRAEWLQIAQVALLILLPCLCYWPAMRGEFLWDDELLTSRSPLLGSWDGLRKIWFSTVPLDYFPLTNTSFWLEWHLWGASPTGYHLVNLALHIASAFLLWRLLLALRLPGAWFGALLFAVHPINVASVAWIAERKNALSMVFYLATLLAFVRWREQPASWRPYLAALGWYVLAALAKSSVVMLPCALLLIVWWQDGRLRWRDLVRTTPFFAVSLAAGLLTMWFQYHRTMTADSFVHARPLAERALLAAHAAWFYLGKILFPHPLAMLYPRSRVNVGDPWSYVALVGLAALLAAAWYARRWWGRGPLAALGYFGVTILPVSGMMAMSFFNYADVSDHLVYLSAPVVLVGVAAWLGRWHAEGGRRGQVALAAMTLAAGACCLGCTLRAEDFSNEEHLWTTTLAINPDSAAAHNNLGLTYQQHAHGDSRLFALAETHFRAALDREHELASAGVNLANVLRMQGRWTESAELYRKALDAHPEPEVFNNYGVSLLEAGDSAKAREAFGNALRLDPSMVSAYYNLFGIEQAEHRLPQAFAMLRACLRLEPDNVQALNAMVLLNLDQPGQPPPTPAGAELMVATAERACRLTQYHHSQSLVALSKALLAAGRPAEATRIAARAGEVAVADHQADLAAAIEDYRRSLPR